jgi:5-methylthioadenosine/S-adenosylhomocysteine deaminase
MKRLIRNASYLLAGNQVLENAFLGIDGDRIAFVSRECPEDFRADDVIEAKGYLVMPGLINTHTHLPMTILRSYADGYPFHTWLFDKIMPIEDRMDGDITYWSALLGIAEMIKSGTTDFVDMYFFSEQIAKAVEETKIRAQITRPITAGDHFNRVFDEAKRLIAQYHGASSGKITVSVSPHAVYTNTPQTLEKCARLAREHGLCIHTHISETKKENADCMAQYGTTPTGLMQDVGIFENRVIAAHCVYLNEADMDIFKRSGATVAHNPTSNLKLGNGVAPILKYQKAGINVSLGTDGTASNNNLNMLEEMHLAGLLLCGINEDPAVCQSADLIQMATKNGAKAQGIEDLGCIAPGCLADIILVSLKEPHMYPQHNIQNNLCFSAQAADVDTVIVGGEVLMEHRELKTIDYEKVIAEMDRCIARLF